MRSDGAAVLSTNIESDAAPASHVRDCNCWHQGIHRLAKHACTQAARTGSHSVDTCALRDIPATPLMEYSCKVPLQLLGRGAAPITHPLVPA